ncbi:helix-turn-helix domain-containing protein [Nostoc sp.]|uniref:helix-turn-helix domain-containing protein n=1 Tax=Nostoc sp. TaxID=1180 RepID=UPI003FA5DC5A
MTITLTLEQETDLWAEARQNSQQTSLEPFEFYRQIPKQLGKGYVRDIEVYPQLWLGIDNYEYYDDILSPDDEGVHPLQFAVRLSGTTKDEYGGQLGEGYTLISGGGIQKKITLLNSQSNVGIGFDMPPELLATFFPTGDGEILPQLRFLAKTNEWQTLLYPKNTTAIQMVAQQIVNCPYHGMTRRLYLQGKVLELMALQLAPFLAEQTGVQPSPRLKNTTIARIHDAKEILLSHLDNPPSILELSQMVRVSDRTLKRGFRELFNTTVFGYLTNKRMELAQQWLQQGTHTVKEVAMLVGYTNPVHFAVAFKRQFGITPSECMGIMRIERSLSNTWLWLLIFLPLLIAQSVQAQVKQNQPTSISSRDFKATADSSASNRRIRQLSEIEHPATNASGLLSQSSTPQATPASGIVQIKGVKANPTDKGVEVILETPIGAQLQVTNRSTGNNFIVDVAGGQLRLPDGNAFTFRSQKPVAGITEITVTNIDANTVRVTVVGVAALPTVELFDDNTGLVFAVATTATAMQPPQTLQTQEKPASQTPQETPTTQDDEPIKLVVTGEQDGYRVPDTIARLLLCR